MSTGKTAVFSAPRRSSQGDETNRNIKDRRSSKKNQEGESGESTRKGSRGYSEEEKRIEDPPVYIGGTGIVVTDNNKNARNGNLPFRKCCLFWTCCCRCSCLNMKHPASDQSKMDPLNGESEPMPTIEDIREWGDSFDRLMKWSVGRKAFRDFLKCEYSEENILFWQAVEELKKERNPSIIEEKARLIYEDYVSILSPKEVSLDSRVRELINRNMIEPTPNTFDEAQTQIYTLMHRDSYPRFINSPYYKKIAQINNNGSRKESTT